MCKNKNMGGRCASHTRQVLADANARYESDRSRVSRTAVQKAVVDYYSTDSGWKEIEVAQEAYNIARARGGAQHVVFERKTKRIKGACEARRDFRDAVKDIPVGQEAEILHSSDYKDLAYQKTFGTTSPEVPRADGSPESAIAMSEYQEKREAAKLCAESMAAFEAMRRNPTIGNRIQYERTRDQYLTTKPGLEAYRRELDSMEIEHDSLYSRYSHMATLDDLEVSHILDLKHRDSLREMQAAHAKSLEPKPEPPVITTDSVPKRPVLPDLITSRDVPR